MLLVDCIASIPELGMVVYILSYGLGYDVRGAVVLSLHGLADVPPEAKTLIKQLSLLQYAQLAGASHGFRSPSDLEFAIQGPVVPFDGAQGEKKPLADLTIRETAGQQS